MKIVYVYSTLAKTGGTERMLTEKANYLADRFGFDVTIINCFQLAHETNVFALSERVKQINLGIPYFEQYKYGYPKRLMVKMQANKMLKQQIWQSVQQEDPDILVGTSRFKANIISQVKCRAKKIIECHEVRYNTLYDAGVKRSFFTSIFMKIYGYSYFRAVEKHADGVVTLTAQDKDLWRKAKRVEVIPNFSSMQVKQYSDCSQKRVIAAGRLAWEKGFGRLIEAWGIVSARHPDWHLDILGEGMMHSTLTTLAKIYKAKNLNIRRFTADMSAEYASSSICVVTSYFEGFSLVLLEALEHGVPCVAFDCPFGPRSIINDAHDGFLVNDGDVRLFAERVCRLIEDENLRLDFSKAAVEKAKAYNVDAIMQRWKSLFESCYEAK